MLLLGCSWRPQSAGGFRSYRDAGDRQAFDYRKARFAYSPSATEIAVFDVRRAFDYWGQSIQPQAEYNAHGLPEFPAYVARLEVSRTDIFHKLQQENLVAHDEATVDGIF